MNIKYGYFNECNGQVDMSEVHNTIKTRIPPLLGGGPHGYGDPDDKRLRKTESDIIIPKLIREEAAKKCSDTFEDFANCAKQEGFFVVFNCRAENNAHNECLKKWATNSAFVKEVTDKYLEARSHFRRTGEALKQYERIKSAK